MRILSYNKNLRCIAQFTDICMEKKEFEKKKIPILITSIPLNLRCKRVFHLFLCV
jgi:hypothetical protein